MRSVGILLHEDLVWLHIYRGNLGLEVQRRLGDLLHTNKLMPRNKIPLKFIYRTKKEMVLTTCSYADWLVVNISVDLK